MNHIIEQLPGYVAWKDKNFRYLGCNLNFAHSLQLKNPHEIVGLTDFDFCHEKEILKFYHQHDQLALSGKVTKIIHSIGSPDPSKSFHLEKKPLRDNKGQTIGIIFHCYELINTEFRQNPLKLTLRESECLMGILHGMTAKSIAEKLNLSKRTIEFYIENIKNKFGCHTKFELILLAFEYGYHKFLTHQLP